MKAPAFIIALAFCYGSAVKTGENEHQRDEISFGSVVDYVTIKSYYPFMARLIMDASSRCGGAVISDR